MALSAKRRYLVQALGNPNVRSLITEPKLASECLDAGKGIVCCRKPQELFSWIHNQSIHENNGFAGRFATRIDPSAEIASTAIVADNNVEIGAGVRIGHYCVIEENCTIGADTVVEHGSMLGIQGPSIAAMPGDRAQLRFHGGVHIGRGCLFLAGACVARGFQYSEFTRIGDGVQVGSRALISHNVSVGDRTFIAHGSVLTGYSRIGSECRLGAGVIVSNRVQIGDRACLNIGAVVVKDVPTGGVVSGNFATEHRANVKSFVQYNRRRQGRVNK